METLQAMLKSAPVLMVTVAVQYRLSVKALGVKYSRGLTFCLMFFVYLLTGWLNLQFHLAEDIGANTFYYAVVAFGLYAALFKGGAIKKLFFTVLLCCGFPICLYVLLPFATYCFGQNTAVWLVVLKILEGINVLLCAAGVEYVGNKFQNLRRELPAGYTVYLTAVILFVYVAVYSGYDRVMIVNRGVVSLPAALTTSLFAVAGVAIVLVAIFAVDRQVAVSLQEQHRMLQEENLKGHELTWRRISGFRHDLKNHLICLENLLETGKTEQAALYMRSLTDTVKQLEDPVQTGNDYADALLNVKYAEAVAAGIAVSIEMAIPPQGFVEPMDLCCILSNAFDNAIAACKHLPEGEKWITACAFLKQGQFVIVIKNSKPPYVTVVNGEVLPKQIAADHGLGLDNVKAVVEKYGGTWHLAADEAFSFSVLLPPHRL